MCRQLRVRSGHAFADHPLQALTSCHVGYRRTLAAGQGDAKARGHAGQLAYEFSVTREEALT